MRAPAVTPTTARAQAILRHPDQTSAWSVVVAGSLVEGVEAAVVEERLAALASAVPSVGARLVDDTWVPGGAPQLAVVDGDPLTSPLLTARFSLGTEAPLRIVVSTAGDRIALAGHHAAFDGLGLVAALGALVGGPLPQPAPPATETGDQAVNVGTRAVTEVLARLARPADPVAPSRPRPTVECFTSHDVQITRPHFTARLAAAAVRAVAAHNALVDAPWERIAVSVGVAGPPGLGNLASYRRVVLRHDGDAAAAVTTALEDPSVPPELSRAPKAGRWLRPVASRLSDSLLVSNVGRHDLEGVSRLEFFPVARGRSAVAIGAAGVAAGRATVTLRARWLSPSDAARLLNDTVASL